jgi:hypothetical protein
MSVYSFLGTLSGTMKTGWAVVAIYLVFVLAYAFMIRSSNLRSS